VLALVAFTLPAIGGACGKQLDVSKPERAIAAAIEERYSIDVQDVSCPQDLKAKKGAQFQCVVTLEGDRLTADVTQTDSSGGLRYQLVEQILTERSVAKAIRAQYNATSVDCGKRTYWVAHPNRTFTCRARDDAGGAARITVTVRDERGNIDLDIAN
jgi:hypothetical protein